MGVSPTTSGWIVVVALLHAATIKLNIRLKRMIRRFIVVTRVILHVTRVSFHCTTLSLCLNIPCSVTWGFAVFSAQKHCAVCITLAHFNLLLPPSMWARKRVEKMVRGCQAFSTVQALKLLLRHCANYAFSLFVASAGCRSLFTFYTASYLIRYANNALIE